MASPPPTTNGPPSPTSRDCPSPTPNASTASTVPACADDHLTHLLTIHRPLPSPTTSFTTHTTSLISLPPSALFTPLTNLTPTPQSYSSVQASRTLHVSLNSALRYTDHSCAPALEFDMARREVRVSRDRALRVGDRLTYFYPSTEWAMARPFACRCGAEGCLGWIGGAGEMGRGRVRGYWLNGFVEEMLGEGEGEKEDDRGVER